MSSTYPGLRSPEVHHAEASHVANVCKIPFDRWTLQLWREPNNQYDRNAIAVAACGKKIGYIPREEALQIAKDGIYDQLKAVPASIFLGNNGKSVFIDIHLLKYSKACLKSLAPTDIKVGSSKPVKPQRKPRKVTARAVPETAETPCSHCGQVLTITPDLFNIKLECPQCGKHLIIEEPEQ